MIKRIKHFEFMPRILETETHIKKKVIEILKVNMSIKGFRTAYFGKRYDWSSRTKKYRHNKQ